MRKVAIIVIALLLLLLPWEDVSARGRGGGRGRGLGGRTGGKPGSKGDKQQIQRLRFVDECRDSMLYHGTRERERRFP